MKKIIPFLSIALFAGTAWADVPSSAQVFVTWGDFDVVVNTFERVALMVSDSTYHGLFFGIITLSLVFGIISSFGNGFLTGQANPLAWVRVLGTIIIGVIIYQTFIQKTSQIVIYDETLNLQKTVADVPDGLILLAGMSNKIEKGLVDIIWTSADPYSYKEAAGGSIFNILKSAYGKNVNLNSMPNGGDYIRLTLQRYINDCLLYEMARPGTAINVNSFNNTVNLEDILALAQSDAISTVIYNDSYPGGLTGTCTECWAEINNYLTALTPTSPAVERFYQESCGIAGLLNVTGATGVDVNLTSANKVTSFISALLGSSVSKSQIVTQKIIADELWTAVNNGDSAAIANRQTGVSMTGMGNMANDWIPILKSLVFAIFIGLFPFVCLLIPTPLFGRAISFMFGSFLFLTAWGVCDALIHSFAMDKAVALFREISTTGLGMNSHLMFESESSKALAMFGAARWSSMMLAGVLSAMIAKFGGYAMSQFSSQLSMAKMHGAEAESMVSSPDTKAHKLHSLEASIPSQTLSNEHGFNKLSQIEMYRRGSALKGDMELIQEWGGGDVNRAIGRKSENTVVNALGDEARTRELGREGSIRQGRNTGEEAKERSKGDRVFLDEYADTLEGQQHYDRIKSTANSYAKMGIAEQVNNGEVSEGTKAMLNKLSTDGYGRQTLQEAGQGHVFSNVSSSEADRFNEMARAAGSDFDDFKAQAGDKVTLSGMYDEKSGVFHISNIRADHMGQENRGQDYNHVDKRRKEIVDGDGHRIEMQTPDGDTVLSQTTKGTVFSDINKRTIETVDGAGHHVETQTLDGKTVLSQTNAGEKVDISSRHTSGNKIDSSSTDVSGKSTTIFENRTVFQSGFDAQRSAAANILFEQTGSMPITASLLAATRDASLISQFANPVTAISGVGLLGTDGLNQIREAFKLNNPQKAFAEPLNPRFGKSDWD